MTEVNAAASGEGSTADKDKKVSAKGRLTMNPRGLNVDLR